MNKSLKESIICRNCNNLASCCTCDSEKKRHVKFREVKAGEIITRECEWIGDEFFGRPVKPVTKRPTKQPKKGK